MVSVIIPSDEKFSAYKTELKNMYENVQDKICDTNSFDFIMTNTLFYGFLHDSVLLGAIYFFVDDEGKLFLNGFAGRKHLELNLECLRMSLGWFSSEIYAEAQNKASAYCLLRCGFRRVKGKLFCYVPTSSC